MPLPVRIIPLQYSPELLLLLLQLLLRVLIQHRQCSWILHAALLQLLPHLQP
jgi:hypothetical protein